MPTRTIHGAAIHYDESGHGLPVVLVHGFPLDNRIFEEQTLRLEKTHRVIRPACADSENHNPTRRSPSHRSADDLHALPRKSTHCPACSAVCRWAVTSHSRSREETPAILAGLILIDTRSEADTSQAKEGSRQNDRSLRGPNGAKVDRRPDVLQDARKAESADRRRPPREQIMESQSPLTIEHALRRFATARTTPPTCRTIAVPTLIIVGVEDAITPPDMARKLNASIPRSQLVEIPGARTSVDDGAAGGGK